MYGAPDTQSSEMLLPPSRARVPRNYQDLPSESPAPSRPQSIISSRRTSFSSDGGRSRDSRHGPIGVSPFDDSRAPSRAGSSDDGDVNTQTVSEKYNIMPSAGLLLYPEDVEKDDWLHNPDPNESDREKCDVFTKRGVVNIGGLALITLGILAIFIGYPVMYGSSEPLSRASTHTNALQNVCTKSNTTFEFRLFHRSDVPVGQIASAKKCTARPYRPGYPKIRYEQEGT
jgi:hypothetical protein